MATEQQTQDPTADANASADSGNGGKDSLTVTDNRTGKSYELPISDGTVRAMDLRQVKVDEDEFGLMAYDPAFTNTASCRSSITYIDGAAGILEHRGYSIEQLCEKSTFLEVAYLLIFGQLPTAPQLDRWVFDITHHTFVTRTSSTSSRASATTPTRWGCCWPGSAPSRPSTPTRSRSPTPKSATWPR